MFEINLFQRSIPMRKSIVIPLVAILIVAAALVAWKVTGTTETVNVTITQNLNEKGWYWTQYNLPADGELMVLTDWNEYRETEAFASSLANYGVNHGRVFFGNFCCGETIPQKYVFLPTDDLNAGVKTLVFFAKDGSIWTMPVPEELLTPKNGEITVQAVIYR
jgi:hypothetical protein